MEIKQAILVASAVRYFPDGNPRRRDIRRLPAIDLLTLIGPSYLLSSHTIYEVSIPDGDWSGLVKNIYTVDVLFGEYRMEVYFLVLHAECVQGLFKKLPGERLDAADKFFRAFTDVPQDGESVLLSQHYSMRTTRTLYLEPADDLVQWWKQSAEGSEDMWTAIAREMRRFIGKESVVAQPAHISGVMLFHGLELRPAIDQTTMGIYVLAVPEYKGPSLLLPATVMRLIELQQLGMVSSHLKDLARRHPFVSNLLERYIQELRTSGPLSLSYDQTFVRDKIGSDLLSLRMEERLREINQRIATNPVTTEIQDGSVKFLNLLPSALYTYNSLDKLMEFAREEMQAAREALTTLVSHSRTLSEVLRDAVVSETSRTNLMLQKSMKRLTYGGIVIAIVALVTAFVPDATKQEMFDSLVGRWLDRNCTARPCPAHTATASKHAQKPHLHHGTAP